MSKLLLVVFPPSNKLKATKAKPNLVHEHLMTAAIKCVGFDLLLMI